MIHFIPIRRYARLLDLLYQAQCMYTYIIMYIYIYICIYIYTQCMACVYIYIYYIYIYIYILHNVLYTITKDHRILDTRQIIIPTVQYII